MKHEQADGYSEVETEAARTEFSIDVPDFSDPTATRLFAETVVRRVREAQRFGNDLTIRWPQFKGGGLFYTAPRNGHLAIGPGLHPLSPLNMDPQMENDHKALYFVLADALKREKHMGRAYVQSGRERLTT